MQTLKMLQLCVSRMCKCISFCISKTVREVRGFVQSIAKDQLKQANHKLNRRKVDAHSAWRFNTPPEALRKVLFPPDLVGNKASFLDSRKLWLRSYAMKKPNTTVLEKDLQLPLLTRSTINGRMRMMQCWNAGTISGIFFVSFYSASCLSPGDLVQHCLGQPVDWLVP